MYWKEVPKINWIIFIILCIVASIVIYIDTQKDAYMMIAFPICYGFDAIMLYDPQDKYDNY